MQHYFGKWIFSYPKLYSWFFDEQRQLLMRLHPLRNKRQLTMRLHPVMNEWQLTYFLLFEVLFFFFCRLFLGTSPLTHTWLIESEVLPCPSCLVIIERVGVRDSLSHGQFSLLQSSADSCLLLSSADGQMY